MCSTEVAEALSERTVTAGALSALLIAGMMATCHFVVTTAMSISRAVSDPNGLGWYC
jgi:hypothetical protein